MNKAVFSLIFLLIVGCSTVTRLPNSELIQSNKLGSISELKGIRYWGDENKFLSNQQISKIRERIVSRNLYRADAPVNFLALSGGGQNGAFCAGILAGWTVHGDRPNFDIVTGISAGALVAPFAFLGSEYDNVIENLYSSYSTDDVLWKRILSGIFSGDSVTDNKPLRKIIMQSFTPIEMAKVAKEYKKGRCLLIGTTYLDARRPVVWDIGAIAASGFDGAYELIIDVMLASTAIPGVFPPVYFDVERNGQIYDELHVDGGVTTQVFLTKFAFDLDDTLNRIGLSGPANIYLIRNAKIDSDIKFVKPKTLSIVSSSFYALMRAQSLGDMYTIYQDSLINNIGYNVAYIPSSFDETPKENFDTDYMKSLFEFAYNQAAIGYPWKNTPPAGNGE